MRTNIFIRADSSTRMGTGHIMRCLTLAEELRDAGAVVNFVTRAHPGNLNELIRKKRFRCHELPGVDALGATIEKHHDSRSEYTSWLAVSQQRDAEETIEAFSSIRPDWLIVDHYGLDEDWENILRPYVSKIMVIDDLADRRHDSDLLLDQNFFVDGERRYDKLIPPSCTKLLSPKYALLRREFRECRKHLRERSGEVKRILVFLGGSDPENFTGMAIEALSEFELLHLQVDVVIGSQNPNREKIKRLVQTRPRTMLHIQAINMAELMCAADLAIGAGGSTTWERCCLGLPCIVIPIAKNQIGSTTDLNYRGAIMSLGGDERSLPNRIQSAVMRLIENPKDVVEIAKTGIEMVPCDGVNDVTALLIGQLSEIKLTHREATLADSKLYWYWANDPEVRRNAFNSKPISWEDHQIWFNSRIENLKTKLLIFESKYGAVGQVRLEGIESQKTISYSVARQFRGMGIGTKMIAQVVSVNPSYAGRFVAEVKKENRVSIGIFQKLGFNQWDIIGKNAFGFSFERLSTNI